MPPAYVKPYVNKNDAADAEAICEEVTRPNMRLVSIKTQDQQSILMLHRARMLFIRQRTMTIDAIRAHLAKFGVAGIGRNGLLELLHLKRPKRGLFTGTQSAESIMASGHGLCRVERPDTWQLRPAAREKVDKALAKLEPSTHSLRGLVYRDKLFPRREYRKALEAHFEHLPDK